MSKKMPVGKAIKFNPSESIINGSIAKKIPMGVLTEFQRKISGFEYSEYNNGPKFRNGDTVVAKITPCLENGKTAFVDILMKLLLVHLSLLFLEKQNIQSQNLFTISLEALYSEKELLIVWKVLLAEKELMKIL